MFCFVFFNCDRHTFLPIAVRRVRLMYWCIYCKETNQIPVWLHAWSGWLLVLKTVCRYYCSTTNDTLALCFHGLLLTLQKAPSKFADVTCYVVGRLCTWLAAVVRVCLGTCYWIRPPRRRHHPPNSKLLRSRQTLSSRWSGSSRSRSSGGNRRENKLSSLRSGTNKLSPSRRRRSAVVRAMWSTKCYRVV